jgi:nitric oxide reductase NorQ protein
MVGIELGFPSEEVELEVLRHETGIPHAAAQRLVRMAAAIRRVEASGLREVASTRTLVTAGRLMAAGVDARAAAWGALGAPLTDDPQMSEGLRVLIDSYMGAAE